MKKIIMSVIAAVILISCDLEKYPLDKVTPQTFYNSASDLKLHTNSFYKMVPSAEEVYNEGQDNIIKSDVSDEMRGTRIVPTSGGGWSWGDLRNINFYLENSVKCKDLVARNRYDAVARFFRAWFYYDMVARFGDVPWYEKAMAETDTEALTKPRDSRVFVMDKIMADLDFAIANLPAGKTVNEISKWTALSLKARVCLFEGTFRKYHTELKLVDADKFLGYAAAAASEVIAKSGYTIYKTGNPKTDYMMLFASINAISSEVILARSFSNDVQVYHNVNYYTMTASYGRPGVEKAVLDSYLMADGTRFTDQPGYKTMQFFEETQNRDPR
ncbi:MAG: RagB/SusD family nutrient uptake outer membrane protein, partial [Rikenellaceae bacterium]